MKLFPSLAVVLFSGGLLASTNDPWGSYPKRPLELRDFVPPDGRRFSLIQEFPYIDQSGRSWPAPVDAIVDGASIPRPFWVLIGGPFEGLYREASVVHDVACCAQMQRWQDVHHMFYNAMRCSGVGWAKAKTMFFAVWAGGPRWTKLNTDMPAHCKLASPTPRATTTPSQISLALDIFSKILAQVRTRPLTPPEAEAIARAFFSKGPVTVADAGRFVSRLKEEGADTYFKEQIVASVIQSERFGDEDVEEIEGWIAAENPALETIQSRADEARTRKVSKLRLFPEIPELLELVNQTEPD